MRREDKILLDIVHTLQRRHRERNRQWPYSGFGWRWRVAARYFKRYYQTPAVFERVMSHGYTEGFDDVARATEMSLEAASQRCTCGRMGMLYRAFINRALGDRKEFFECVYCGAVEAIQ